MTTISGGTSPLPQGKTIRVAREVFTTAKTQSYTLSTDADAILVSLYVETVSGDLDVALYTQTEEGKDLLITQFPTVSAPTANLLLKKGATIINQIRVEVTTTAAATFELYARGVGTGESSVRILGPSVARASQTTIPAVATLIIPASLTDRSGLVIKNNNPLGGAIMYIGFTALEATAVSGYPISAGESLGMDLSSGVTVYGISASGTTDIRLLEAGS